MSIRKIVPIEQAEWSVAPAPAWVEARDPDWSFTPPEGHAIAILLIDEQHHVATQAIAQRSVRQLLTLAAVQSLAQVEVDFDPAAYRLLIHELAVWRQGADGFWEKRSLAQCENFMLRQREQQLTQQMLNGRVSLIALLEDVRVGDAIDLAWTIEPRDALSGLRFAAFFAFVWNVPVARGGFTLHLDPQHPLQWHLHVPEGIEPPAVDITPERAGWRVERPPVFVSEENVPAGYWPFTVLEVSGWTDWPQVAFFFAELWCDALNNGAEAIAAEAARLREGGDAIRAAIRFAQEEVRYLAVDFGHGAGMLPNGAGTVLRRRFGDCKDKAVLLTALLRALGVEAWPMLVGANWREAVARMQPSTACFNHAIVTFIANGRRHFVDPTLVGQGGDLARLVAPPYGCGLEVRSDAGGLLTLPELPPAELTLTETFDLDRNQCAGAVEQELHATSWLADDVRAALVQLGQAAFFKVRAESLQKHFPALVASENAGALNDDGNANVIKLRARHTLPTWGMPGEKPPPMFAYGAHGLFLAVDLVDGSEQRRQPWELRFPLKVRHRVVVRGKCVRKAKPEQHRFSGPGFRYACDVDSRRGEVTFDYRWETTERAIAPERWAEYCRERAKAFNHAGANVATASRTHLVSWVMPIMVIALFVLGAFNKHDTMRPQRLSAAGQQQLASDMRNAWEAARRGDVHTAEPVIERIREHYTSNYHFQMMRGDVALRTRHFERAREAIATARKLDPQNIEVDLLDASLHENLGELAAARGLLERVIARTPEDNRAYSHLARITDRMGDVEAACAAWKKVLERLPAHPEALFNFARLLWKTGERERADTTITTAIRAQPASSALLESALAQYYQATGRHAEAVAPARRAVELAPEDPMIAYRHVMTIEHAGGKIDALDAARQMTVRFPTNPLAWGALATAAAVGGDTSTAESAFKKWLQLAPADPDAHSNWGFFLHKSSRSTEARAVLAKASRDFPGHGMVWLNYSVVLEALGETQPAAEARRKADALLTDEQRATMLR